MLYSNLPVQDQQDGVWNGVGIGAAIGGAAGYGAQRNIVNDNYSRVGAALDQNRYENQMVNYQNDNNYKRGENGAILKGDSNANKSALETLRNQHDAPLKRMSEKGQARTDFTNSMKKQFGGSRGKQSAVYSIGGAALGAAIGGLTDSLL